MFFRKKFDACHINIGQDVKPLLNPFENTFWLVSIEADIIVQQSDFRLSWEYSCCI